MLGKIFQNLFNKESIFIYFYNIYYWSIKCSTKRNNLPRLFPDLFWDTLFPTWFSMLQDSIGWSINERNCFLPNLHWWIFLSSFAKLLVLDFELHSSENPGQKLKIFSKLFIEPSVKCKTIKLLEDNTGETLLWSRDEFLDTTAKVVKEIISWMSLHIFNCYERNIVKGLKYIPWTGRKYLQKTYLIKDLLSWIYTLLLKLNHKKIIQF